MTGFRRVLFRSNSSNTPVDSAPFAELDKLYLQILSSCPTSNQPLLKRILGYIVVPHPARITEDIVIDTHVIEAFLCLAPGHAKVILRRLRSLVSFRDDEIPKLHHASFGDFLLDKERSKDYHVDPEEWSYTAFCDAFSLGCKRFRSSVDAGSRSTSRHLAKGQGLFVTLISPNKTDASL